MYGRIGALSSLAARNISCGYVSLARPYCSPPAHPALLKDIGYKELSEGLKQQSLVLLDVRTVKELETAGAIPGAINLPLDKFGHLILLPKEDFNVRIGVTKPTSSTLIVTMCRSGVRARTAQLALHGAGYTNVRRYLGSFIDWKENGGVILKPSEDDLA